MCEESGGVEGVCEGGEDQAEGAKDETDDHKNQ